MWDYKYGRFTVRERWEQMWGYHDTPFFTFLRICVMAFAAYTMSYPEASFHIAPGWWVLIYALWYWYPS
jgi:hypothetical protein